MVRHMTPTRGGGGGGGGDPCKGWGDFFREGGEVIPHEDTMGCAFFKKLGIKFEFDCIMQRKLNSSGLSLRAIMYFSASTFFLDLVALHQH